MYLLHRFLNISSSECCCTTRNHLCKKGCVLWTLIPSHFSNMAVLRRLSSCKTFFLIFITIFRNNRWRRNFILKDKHRFLITDVEKLSAAVQGYKNRRQNECFNQLESQCHTSNPLKICTVTLFFLRCEQCHMPCNQVFE